METDETSSSTVLRGPAAAPTMHPAGASDRSQGILGGDGAIARRYYRLHKPS